MTRLRVLAVSARLPAWADSACTEYARRMPRGYAFEHRLVKPAPRREGAEVARLRHAEAQRLATAVPPGALRIALDERGADLDTRRFAARLAQWREAAGGAAFLIGGPDGLDPALREACAFSLRLSSLTLPHALAQVLLCEQLYRAACVLTGHPYHRD